MNISSTWARLRPAKKGFLFLLRIHITNLRSSPPAVCQVKINERTDLVGFLFVRIRLVNFEKRRKILRQGQLQARRQISVICQW